MAGPMSFSYGRFVNKCNNKLMGGILWKQMAGPMSFSDGHFVNKCNNKLMGGIVNKCNVIITSNLMLHDVLENALGRDFCTY